MSGQHPVIAFDVAISHQDDLLHEAETRRLSAVAGSHRPARGTGLRRRAGSVLVHLGQRLQSTHRHRNAGDLAAASVLRISR